MNQLQQALKDKYGTPEKALAALGLSPDLLAADQSANRAAPNRNPKMAKLSATAARVHAALTAHLAPLLAADKAMPDITSAVAGITKANLGKSKAAVWKKAKGLTKGALASDAATPDDVALRILDMIDKQGASPDMPEEAEADQTRDGIEPGAIPAKEGAEGAAETEPNAAVPPKKKPGAMVEGEEEPEAEDEEAGIMKALSEKLGDDELAKACYDICMGGAKDEVVDPKDEVPLTQSPSDKDGAKDEEAPMLKPAMDAAIKAAIETERKTARAAQEARQFVRSRTAVGEVSIAFDTADQVYKAALDSLGVSTKGVHPSAYRTILEHLPKSGGHKVERANDSARDSGSTNLAKQYPGAANIRVMG